MDILKETITDPKHYFVWAILTVIVTLLLHFNSIHIHTATNWYIIPLLYFTIAITDVVLHVVKLQ